MDGLMDGIDRGNGSLKGVLFRERDSIGKARGVQIPTEFCHPGKPKKFVIQECHGRIEVSGGSLRQGRGGQIMSLQAER